MSQLKQAEQENKLFHIPDTTQTAIQAVGQITGFTNLNISHQVICETRKQIDLFCDSREALEQLKEIDFSLFKPEYFEEVYYYLECSDFSDEIIDYLDTMGIDVVFLETNGHITSKILKVGDVFYNPRIGAIQLKEVEAPGVENQEVSFFTGMQFKGELVLLRLGEEKCTFEYYVGEPQKIGKNSFQFIKNIYGSYDLLDAENGKLYHINAIDFIIINNYSIRLFLDKQKTMFIDFDGELFGDVTQIDTSEDIDFSDVEEKTIIPKTH